MNKTMIAVWILFSCQLITAQDNVVQPPSQRKITREQLQEKKTKLDTLTKELPVPYAEYLGEDWKTKGDWMGRTFRHWGLLCAAASPFDHPVLFSTDLYDANPFIGPNHDQYDDVRRWVHWVKTDNPKVLWNPIMGYRRQAEWDDHGEVYPLTKDGPHLWYVLNIKHKGTFKVGMYFYNKDGHDGKNRYRDYVVTVYRSPKEWEYKYGQRPIFEQIAGETERKNKPLAKMRVENFWGGVHKYFVMTGHCTYLVKIDRNSSYNTILSSVTIDRLVGEPDPLEQQGIPYYMQTPYNPPPFPKDKNETAKFAVNLWEQLDESYGKDGNVAMQRLARVMLYQYAAGNDMKELADAFGWRLNQWDEKQREEWKETAIKAWKKLCEQNPQLIKDIEAKEMPPEIKQILRF